MENISSQFNDLEKFMMFQEMRISFQELKHMTRSSNLSLILFHLMEILFKNAKETKNGSLVVKMSLWQL
jgi:hypothetical protein